MPQGDEDQLEQSTNKMIPPTILLRQWKDSDLDAFTRMNADAEVMKYFIAPWSAEESRQGLQRLRQLIDTRGWGSWAVEVEGAFAGFTGLAEPKFTAHFTPCVEIGWRFLPAYWGRGIAFNAAQQAEHYAFSVLGLDQLVSFTTETNMRSRKLMARLGFSHDPSDDFLHPNIAADHPYCRHILCRKNNPTPKKG